MVMEPPSPDAVRLANRVACRLAKILDALEEGRTNGARIAVEYLIEDLDRLHVVDLNKPD
jgi:hypothetical protein